MTREGEEEVVEEGWREVHSGTSASKGGEGKASTRYWTISLLKTGASQLYVNVIIVTNL